MMIPQILSFVITSVLLSNPWNPIFTLTLFVGIHIPLSKLRPYIDNQGVSRLDDSSIKGEQDKNLPMDENLPKYKTSGKPGENSSPKIPVLDSSDIIGCTFLMMDKSSGFVLLT